MTPGPPSTWSCRRSRLPLPSLYPRLWQEARWVTTYKSDPIWSVLIRSDPLWSDLIRIDPIRWNMRRTHGSLYPRLWQEARWVAYRSDLIQSDPIWSVLIQSDLIWSGLIRSDMKTCDERRSGGYQLHTSCKTTKHFLENDINKPAHIFQFLTQESL